MERTEWNRSKEKKKKDKWRWKKRDNILENIIERRRKWRKTTWYGLEKKRGNRGKKVMKRSDDRKKKKREITLEKRR